MMLDHFRASLTEPVPPAGMPPLVEALWWDARGDWSRAHAIAQEVETADGAWVHAYLHRREGDPGNAAYWYRRANRPGAQGSFDEERLQIAAVLLG